MVFNIRQILAAGRARRRAALLRNPFRLARPVSPRYRPAPRCRRGHGARGTEEAGTMSADAPETPDIARRLERGEVVYYAACPFPLPQNDDLAFLLEQRLA